MKQSILFVALLFCCLTISYARLFPSLKWLYTSAAAYRRVVKAADEYDEMGKLPTLEAVKSAISGASTILIIRAQNDTVVGFSKSKQSRLKNLIGPGPLTESLHPHVHILMTGITSDCHFIHRQIQEFIVKYQYDFDSYPSASYLSRKIGEVFQKELYQSNRFLACQLYLIQTKNVPADSSGIYEINPMGNVCEIFGGVSGKKSAKYTTIFEEHFSEELTTDAAEDLIRTMTTPSGDTQEVQKEEEGDDEIDDRELQVVCFSNVTDSISMKRNAHDYAKESISIG